MDSLLQVAAMCCSVQPLGDGCCDAAALGNKVLHRAEVSISVLNIKELYPFNCSMYDPYSQQI